MSFLVNGMRADSATPSPTNSADAGLIETLRQEVLRKEEELAALQTMFEDLQASSGEIEKELETELDRAEAEAARLRTDYAAHQAAAAALAQAKQDSHAEADRLAQELLEWRQKAEDLRVEKMNLETENDNLETKVGTS